MARALAAQPQLRQNSTASALIPNNVIVLSDTDDACDTSCDSSSTGKRSFSESGITTDTSLSSATSTRMSSRMSSKHCSAMMATTLRAQKKKKHKKTIGNDLFHAASILPLEKGYFDKASWCSTWADPVGERFPSEMVCSFCGQSSTSLSEYFDLPADFLFVPYSLVLSSKKCSTLMECPETKCGWELKKIIEQKAEELRQGKEGADKDVMVEVQTADGRTIKCSRRQMVLKQEISKLLSMMKERKCGVSDTCTVKNPCQDPKCGLFSRVCIFCSPIACEMETPVVPTFDHAVSGLVRYTIQASQYRSIDAPLQYMQKTMFESLAQNFTVTGRTSGHKTKVTAREVANTQKSLLEASSAEERKLFDQTGYTSFEQSTWSHSREPICSLCFRPTCALGISASDPFSRSIPVTVPKNAIAMGLKCPAWRPPHGPTFDAYVEETDRLFDVARDKEQRPKNFIQSSKRIVSEETIIENESNTIPELRPKGPRRIGGFVANKGVCHGDAARICELCYNGVYSSSHVPRPPKVQDEPSFGFLCVDAYWKQVHQLETRDAMARRLGAMGICSRQRNQKEKSSFEVRMSVDMVKLRAIDAMLTTMKKKQVFSKMKKLIQADWDPQACLKRMMRRAEGSCISNVDIHWECSSACPFSPVVCGVKSDGALFSEIVTFLHSSWTLEQAPPPSYSSTDNCVSLNHLVVARIESSMMKSWPLLPVYKHKGDREGLMMGLKKSVNMMQREVSIAKHAFCELRRRFALARTVAQEESLAHRRKCMDHAKDPSTSLRCVLCHDGVNEMFTTPISTAGVTADLMPFDMLLTSFHASDFTMIMKSIAKEKAPGGQQTSENSAPTIRIMYPKTVEALIGDMNVESMLAQGKLTETSWKLVIGKTMDAMCRNGQFVNWIISLSSTASNRG